MQLQNFGTDKEKINRKEINNEESEKSDTEERDRMNILDEVTMIAGKKYGDDDQVNKDAHQGTIEEESEGKDQTEIRKNML